MKKTILLIAVGAFLISIKSEAQQFVASFGAQVEWGVPNRVEYAIGHDFYGYDWVHANRIVRGGHAYFDVILQRGDVFVEVNVGYNGRIIGRTYFDYYPLRGHVCSGHCGYHSNYYVSHRTVCNSHSHHGHNHVVYRPGNGHGHHRPNGHAYGYYKNHNKHKNYNKHYKHNNRVVYTRNNEPVRRGRYYEYNDRDDRGHGGHDDDDRYHGRKNGRNDHGNKHGNRGGRGHNRSYKSRSSRSH